MVSLGHTIKQRTVLLAHTRRARMGQAYKKQLICENQFLGTRMDFAIGKKKILCGYLYVNFWKLKLRCPFSSFSQDCLCIRWSVPSRERFIHFISTCLLKDVGETSVTLTREFNGERILGRVDKRNEIIPVIDTVERNDFPLFFESNEFDQKSCCAS